MSFDALFRPRAVAVFGSVSPGKLGGILIDQLLAGGFCRVYAVNPKAQAPGGVPAYASIFDAPDDVDLAVVATPAATVAAILEDCGKRGIRAAVVISSGYLSEELRLEAARLGVRQLLRKENTAEELGGVLREVLG